MDSPEALGFIDQSLAIEGLFASLTDAVIEIFRGFDAAIDIDSIPHFYVCA